MGTEEAWRRLTTIAHIPDEEIDLDWAALVLAATAYPDLDISRETAALDSLASGALRRLGDRRDDPLSCMNTLSEYLFDEMGFRGNEDEYYDPRNSYLNEVLTRRIGIPITLSLLYIETGRRLSLPLLGVGMPGHFIVRHRDVDDLFVDPFHGGILLTEEECAHRVRQVTQVEFAWDRRYLTPVSNRDLITRMIRNLKSVHLSRRDYPKARRMIDWLVAAEPGVPQELRDRGIVNYQLGDYARALDDLRAYIASSPNIVDTGIAHDLITLIEQLE